MQLFKNLKASTVTLRNILKLNRNSHTHLTETLSLAWYVAAALKPLS